MTGWTAASHTSSTNTRQGDETQWKDILRIGLQGKFIVISNTGKVVSKISGCSPPNLGYSRKSSINVSNPLDVYPVAHTDIIE